MPSSQRRIAKPQRQPIRAEPFMPFQNQMIEVVDRQRIRRSRRPQRITPPPHRNHPHMPLAAGNHCRKQRHIPLAIVAAVLQDQMLRENRANRLLVAPAAQFLLIALQVHALQPSAPGNLPLVRLSQLPVRRRHLFRRAKLQRRLPPRRAVQRKRRGQRLRMNLLRRHTGRFRLRA